MPVGGGGKPAGGYRAGKKGSYGCEGYPTVSADGTVHGCHPTKAKAQAQARAIWASTAKKFVSGVEKAMVTEGDYVMFLCEEDEIKVGQVEFVMTEGTYGLAGSEYAMEATPEDPVLSIRIFEEEDGSWEATENIHAHKASEAVKIESLMVSMDVVREMQSSSSPEETMQSQMDSMDAYDNSIGKSYHSDNEEEDKWDNMTKACWTGYEQQGMKDKNGRMVPNCVPVNKSEEIDKAKKPNYDEFIKPRSGGSEPANARLYAQIIREAKDKFDVYPSAVANSWVVQEYKRRGGTYKSEKRERSMATRERLAETGAAMPDGSYPIVTEQDLRNAIQSVGRAKNYEAAKEHIISRARALGMMDMLPEDWRNKATKGMGQWSGSVFDLNPFKKYA
jgi:hypothetical protein